MGRPLLVPPPSHSNKCSSKPLLYLHRRMEKRDTQNHLLKFRGTTLDTYRQSYGLLKVSADDTVCDSTVNNPHVKRSKRSIRL